MNAYSFIQYQAIAEPVFIPAAIAVPSLDSWFVEAQQPLQEIAPAQQPDTITYVPSLGQFPIPELSWEGIYPAHVDDIPRLQHNYEFHFWNTETPTAEVIPSMDSWFVEAQQPVQKLIPTIQPDAITYIPALGQFPIPESSWEGVYPNRIEDIARLQHGYEFHFWNTETPSAVVVPSMDSWFQELQQPLQSIIPAIQPDSLTYIPSLGQFSIPELSWEGKAPVRIDDILRLQYLNEGHFWNPETPVFVPPLDSWFKETQQSLQEITPAQQPDAITYMPSLGQFPIPELAWDGTFPASVDGVPQLQYLHEWHFWHPETLVVVPPLDSWFVEVQQPQPGDPTQQPDPTTYLPAVPQFPVPELSWDGEYPERVDGVPQTQYLYSTHFWHPETPAAVVLAGKVLTLTDETLRRSALAAEVLRRSIFDSETFDS